MEGKKLKEKKLTDEEIVKAYEHCYVNDGTCKSCCLTDEDKLCVSLKDVLDLIQRQKAEIERLTKLYDETNSELFDRNIELEDCEKSNKSLQTMNFNLSQEKAERQKQVDELTAKLGEVLLSVKADELLVAKGIEQAVKDTAVVIAKEILQPLYDEATCNVSETVELTTFQIEQYAEYYGVVLE